jgi:hypothetical protein
MFRPEELRRWLTGPQLMERVGRLAPCEYGHFDCSTHHGGPCYAEVLDQFHGMARDRALEMRACGASRVDVWKTINHDYPALGPTTVSTILEEAFSQGLPTPEP